MFHKFEIFFLQIALDFLMKPGIEILSEQNHVVICRIILLFSFILCPNIVL